MKAVLSGKEMKEFDARSIKGYGIPSLVLMERAAMAVAEKAEEILEKEEAGTVDRKSTRLNSSHIPLSRMPSSA